MAGTHIRRRRQARSARLPLPPKGALLHGHPRCGARSSAWERGIQLVAVVSEGGCYCRWRLVNLFRVDLVQVDFDGGQLVTGIIHYCAIPEGHLELLYDVMAGPETRDAQLARVRDLGATYF